LPGKPHQYWTSASHNAAKPTCSGRVQTLAKGVKQQMSDTPPRANIRRGIACSEHNRRNNKNGGTREIHMDRRVFVMACASAGLLGMAAVSAHANGGNIGALSAGYSAPRGTGSHSRGGNRFSEIAISEHTFAEAQSD
jgi:hypothetical protein